MKSKPRQRADIKRRGFLYSIKQGGISYLLCGHDIIIDRLPSFHKVKEAFEKSPNEVLYAGPYTGPGASTGDMYNQAGLSNAYTRSKAENKFRIKEKNARPGPKDYMSIDIAKIDHKDPDKYYEIMISKSPGTPDHCIILDIEPTEKEPKSLGDTIPPATKVENGKTACQCCGNSIIEDDWVTPVILSNTEGKEPERFDVCYTCRKLFLRMIHHDFDKVEVEQ